MRTIKIIIGSVVLVLAALLAVGSMRRKEH